MKQFLAVLLLVPSLHLLAIQDGFPDIKTVLDSKTLTYAQCARLGMELELLEKQCSSNATPEQIAIALQICARLQESNTACQSTMMQQRRQKFEALRAALDNTTACASSSSAPSSSSTTTSSSSSSWFGWMSSWFSKK